tara:strand:- start:4875 stop:5462 length:588 start_codon:yes stop_codon:yes gene_type:complete
MNATTLKSNKGNELEGPKLIHPQISTDERGYFYESWNKRTFNKVISDDISFFQDNISYSKKDVLRGLHYQLDPEPQGKLIRCSSGKIYDVAVDLRKSSPTFGEWISTELSSENKKQLWIPIGFAHGFLTLSEYAEVNYKASGFWNKNCEYSIHWNDKDLNIRWPTKTLDNNPIVNIKDESAPSFNDSISKEKIFK